MIIMALIYTRAIVENFSVKIRRLNQYMSKHDIGSIDEI